MRTGLAERDLLASLWTSGGWLATPLLLAAVDRLGPEFLGTKEVPEGWDPETVWLELEEACGRPPHPEPFNRLMAAAAVVRDDRFYKSLPDFFILCNALTDGHFDPARPEPPLAWECLWGMAEAALIEPPADRSRPYAPVIARYVGLVLDHEGILHPADLLRIGLRRPGLAEAVLAELQDQPELAEHVRAEQTARQRQFQDRLRSGLQRLFHQLEQLPLHTGDARDLLQKVRRGLAPSAD